MVYDLPTRFFHWFFAFFFLTAFIIAKTSDDESATFSYHMFAGLIIAFVVILRIIWGFFGTRHARFLNFELNPSSLIDYFKNIFSNNKKTWAGHNPASSWSAIIMILLALGLSITGITMTSGNSSEFIEDMHEILANSFIVVVILHVCGVVLHMIRYRDKIALSMLDGKKQNVPNGEVITSIQKIPALIFIALVFSLIFYIKGNYSLDDHLLKIGGITLKLEKNKDSDKEKEESE